MTTRHVLITGGEIAAAIILLSSLLCIAGFAYDELQWRKAERAGRKMIDLDARRNGSKMATTRRPTR